MQFSADCRRFFGKPAHGVRLWGMVFLVPFAVMVVREVAIKPNARSALLNGPVGRTWPDMISHRKMTDFPVVLDFPS